MGQIFGARNISSAPTFDPPYEMTCNVLGQLLIVVAQSTTQIRSLAPLEGIELP